jgi:hypothetical protein
MAVTTVSDLSSLFNTIYERALFVAREQNLMAALVDNRSATGWMNRVVPTRPAITAVSVTESQDFSSPTTFGRSTAATLTPGEIIAQVVLTDRDMETDPDSAMNDAVIEMGGAIATKIDTDLVGAFSSFTTDKGDGAGNSATFENFAAGCAVVRYNKATQFGPINAVMHPYHWHDLWLELGKPAATLAALGDVTTQALRDYFVGTLLGGVRIFTSSNIAVDTGIDAISGIFVGPAIMLDTRRQMRMEQERDASARAWELNVTAGYAYGIVRSTFGVKFTADAAEPS